MSWYINGKEKNRNACNKYLILQDGRYEVYQLCYCPITTTVTNIINKDIEMKYNILLLRLPRVD